MKKTIKIISLALLLICSINFFPKTVSADIDVGTRAQILQIVNNEYELIITLNENPPEIPKTGENTNMDVWLIFMIVSAGAGISIIFTLRNEKK